MATDPKQLIERLASEGSLDEAKAKAEADFEAFRAEHAVSFSPDAWASALETVSDDELDQVTGGKISLTDLDIEAKGIDPTQNLVRNRNDVTH